MSGQTIDMESEFQQSLSVACGLLVGLPISAVFWCALLAMFFGPWPLVGAGFFAALSIAAVLWVRHITDPRRPTELLNYCGATPVVRSDAQTDPKMMREEK